MKNWTVCLLLALVFSSGYLIGAQKDVTEVVLEKLEKQVGNDEEMAEAFNGFANNFGQVNKNPREEWCRDRILRYLLYKQLFEEWQFRKYIEQMK